VVGGPGGGGSGSAGVARLDPRSDPSRPVPSAPPGQAAAVQTSGIGAPHADYGRPRPGGAPARPGRALLQRPQGDAASNGSPRRPGGSSARPGPRAAGASSLSTGLGVQPQAAGGGPAEAPSVSRPREASSAGAAKSHVAQPLSARAAGLEACGTSLMTAAASAVGRHGRRPAPGQPSPRLAQSQAGGQLSSHSSHGSFRLQPGAPSLAEPMASSGQVPSLSPVAHQSGAGPRAGMRGSTGVPTAAGFAPTAPSRQRAASGRHLVPVRAGHSRRAMGTSGVPSPQISTQEEAATGPAARTASGQSISRAPLRASVDAAADFVTGSGPPVSHRRNGSGAKLWSPVQRQGAAAGGPGATVSGSAPGGSSSFAFRSTAAKRHGASRAARPTSARASAVGRGAHGSLRDADAVERAERLAAAAMAGSGGDMGATSGGSSGAGAAEPSLAESLDLRVRETKRAGPALRSAPNLLVLAQSEGFPRDLTASTAKSPVRLTAGEQHGLRAQAREAAAGPGLSGGIFRSASTSGGDGGGAKGSAGETPGDVMASAAMVVLQQLRKQRSAKGPASSAAASGSAAAAAAARAKALAGSSAADTDDAAARADTISAAAEDATQARHAGGRGKRGRMSAGAIEKSYLLWELVRRQRSNVVKMASLPEGKQLRTGRPHGVQEETDDDDDDDDDDDEGEAVRIG